MIIIASLFAVIIAAFVVLIKVYVTPERVRKFLVPYAEQTLNRKVFIGEVRISPFRSIRVKDFTIREKDGQADFVRCREFVLRFKLLPLLSKRIVIDELKLVSPDIKITRDENGRFNYEDLGKKEKKEAPRPEEQVPGAKGLPVSLLVHDIRIEDSKFSLVDGLKKFPDTRGSFTLKAGVRTADGSRLASEGDMDLRLDEVILRGKKVKDIRASLSYAAYVDADPADVRIERADLKIQRLTASLTGKVRNLRREPEIDVAVSLPRLALQDVQKELAAFPDLQGLSLSGNISADLKVKGMPLKIETLRADGIVLFEKTGVKLKGLNAVLDGTLKFREQTVNIDVKGASGKNTAEIKGSVSNFRYPRIRLRLHSRQLYLDDFVPLWPGAAVSRGGAAPPANRTREAGPHKLRLSADVEVRIDSLVYKGVDATGFYARYKLGDNKLDIPKMSAAVGNGTVSVNASVDFSRPGYIYYLSADLDSVRAEEVVNSFFPKAGGAVFGYLSTSLRLSGAGTLPESIRRNLVGDGDFRVNDGKITNAKLTESLAALLSIDELKTINLDKASGTMRIRNGLARLDSVFTSDDLSMDPSGDIGLDGSLDLAFDLRLSPRLAKETVGSGVAKYIRDEEGWGMIPLKVSGTLSDPSYDVDAVKAGKRALKREADRPIDKALKDDADEKPADNGTKEKPEGAPVPSHLAP
ncbi:MAG: AsmA family protein [Nitrospirae bacterium]|nr:AsmA family protein [Nitrospirota bacterium]